MKNLTICLFSFVFVACSTDQNANVVQNQKSTVALQSSPTKTPAVVSTVTSDSTKDEKSITSEIKAFAVKQYPDDYNMQKFVFDQQMKAYNVMQKKPSSDIKSFAERQYPDDYNMQKFVFDQQTDAYNFMGKQSESEIKTFAEKQYPEDYNKQRFIYKQQSEAKKEMDKK